MSALSKEHIRRLSDPDWINEGIGCEGFQYPKSDLYASREAQFEYANETFRRIGQMAIEHANGDPEAASNLGQLILGNLINYTKPASEK